MGVAPRMMVAAGALLCQAECARRGVILWSHGRSASDALAGTLFYVSFIIICGIVLINVVVAV